MCSSGDSELKASETAQANFSKELMNTFKTQFANQQGILNFIIPKMQSMVNNPTGFDPTTLATMNTNNIENSATDFANAEKGANEAIAARGGNGLPSGVAAQIAGENATGAATEEATGQRQIALADAQQKQTNYWDALSALNGASTAENPLGYASSATGATGAAVAAGDAFKASQSSQLLGALGGLAGGAGTALAGAKL